MPDFDIDFCQDRRGEVIEYVTEINESVGIKFGLSNYGVTESDLEAIATLALADTCHLSNPRKVTKQDFINILRASL